jgi:hypothetical protein
LSDVIVTLAGAVIVALALGAGTLYSRVRLAAFVEALGGRVWVLGLHLRRGGFDFVATPEPAGRIELRCRKYRTLRPLHLKPARAAPWPDGAGNGLDLSDELRALLAEEVVMQRALTDLLGRVDLRLRIHGEGLAAALRPRGSDLEPRDLSDVLDWLVVLHPRLVARGAARIAAPFTVRQLPRLAGIVLVAFTSTVVVALTFGFAMGHWQQLTSGAGTRVLWHAIPVSLALAGPVCVGLYALRPAERRTTRFVANLVTLGLVLSWPLVCSGMILLNHHLDASPPRTHEVELLEIHQDEEHASLVVRGWDEERAKERFPLPGWFADQLEPQPQCILVEVRAGALGYEHLTALGLPEP